MKCHRWGDVVDHSNSNGSVSFSIFISVSFSSRYRYRPRAPFISSQGPCAWGPWVIGHFRSLRHVYGTIFHSTSSLHLPFESLKIVWRLMYDPVWGGHCCIDFLLSMCILLPRTNTRENNLTSFIIFCCCNLLRAKLWTVIQCPGHDQKLQPHRVNILPYRVWVLACWW